MDVGLCLRYDTCRFRALHMDVGLCLRYDTCRFRTLHMDVGLCLRSLWKPLNLWGYTTFRRNVNEVVKSMPITLKRVQTL